MKPLYWKLLLILGAVIVGASLVVPKALRKNSAQTVDNVSQALFIETSDNNISFENLPNRNTKTVIIVDHFKALTSANYTNFLKSNFEITVNLIVETIAPTHSLNAGTRPIKSRVIV